MPRLARDEGIVLSVRDHAETDRIATLLTLGTGKLAVLAKGARRTTSRVGAYLDPLNRIEAIYYVRKGLNLLRDASLLEHFPAFRSDLERAEAALVGAQLAERLVPDRQPNPAAYGVVVAFLRALAGGLPIDSVRLSYTLHLLASLGHRPHLAGCVACGREDELRWSPDRGGLLCRSCGGEGVPVPAPLWKSLRLLAAFPIEGSGKVRLDPALARFGAELLAAFAEYQIRR